MRKSFCETLKDAILEVDITKKESLVKVLLNFKEFDGVDEKIEDFSSPSFLTNSPLINQEDSGFKTEIAFY
jgi:hypothetical protein